MTNTDNSKIFTTSDTFDEFLSQRHNFRTRNAWNHGVKIAAKGGHVIYCYKWKCHCCGELHPKDEILEEEG